MATENRCPKCGSPLKLGCSGYEIAGCTLDPKDCLIKSLERQIEELKSDSVDAEESADRLRHLLTETANALKGEPELLKVHSWHDLPKLVLELEAAHHSAWAEVHDARSERDTAQSALRASEARELELQGAVVALRDATTSLRLELGYTDRQLLQLGYQQGRGVAASLAAADAAISNTSAAAQEAVKRVEREAVEKAWDRFLEVNATREICTSDFDGKKAKLERSRAAILGEKEG